MIIGFLLLLTTCTVPAVGAAGKPARESPITPAALEALLPDSLSGGFSRNSLQSGIKQSAAGAMGAYDRGADQIELLIYDMAAMDNPRDYTVRERVLFEMEADSVSETEETTLAGYPAFKEPQDELEQEMLVLVGERLVVEASSQSLGNDVLREALLELDWQRIARLTDSSPKLE